MVVPSFADVASVPTIVVGVDGSSGSEHALRWAADEARLRVARLRVLYAWLGPAPAQATLEGTVANVLGPEHGLDLELDLVEGSPSKELLRAAEGSDLLVLGARGSGGFPGLLLGSVCSQVAQHTPCPLVIVPGPER
jgi:nucleotide-binding universal stress UspA family protein